MAVCECLHEKVSKSSCVCNSQAPGWFQRAAATPRRLQEELAAPLVSEQDARLQGESTSALTTYREHKQGCVTPCQLSRYISFKSFNIIVCLQIWLHFALHQRCLEPFLKILQTSDRSIILRVPAWQHFHFDVAEIVFVFSSWGHKQSVFFLKKIPMGTDGT